MADTANRVPCSTPIEAHGVIGNMRTTALVATDGALNFMCYPRIDSPTIFGALLDAGRGGSFHVAPAFDAPRVKQMYLPETNVLVTRFMAPDAVCEVLDFMPLSRADDDAPNCVVRMVRSVYGRVSMTMRCAPRFDYARTGHTATAPPMTGTASVSSHPTAAPPRSRSARQSISRSKTTTPSPASISTNAKRRASCSARSRSRSTGSCRAMRHSTKPSRGGASGRRNRRIAAVIAKS